MVESGNTGLASKVCYSEMRFRQDCEQGNNHGKERGPSQNIQKYSAMK